MARLRVEKLQELIKQELSSMVLLEVKDPRVKLVTITEVELSNDLSYAKVFVSLYGTDEEKEEAWQGLNKAKGFLRSELSKKLNLRIVPTLVLTKDTSADYSAHIEGLLAKLKKEE